MKDTAIDERLLSAARFVRQGAVFADIGSDHAHLALFLLRTGVIERAFCTDVAEGPLRRARENAERAGMSDRVVTLLSDGFSALHGLGINSAAVCGMGGELIARLISEAGFLRDPDIDLILQPMSRQPHLRAYLWENGFRIRAESYSVSHGKPYVCLLASYTGESRSPDPFELEFGEYLRTEDPAAQEYVRRKYLSLRRAAEGSGSGDGSGLLLRCRSYLIRAGIDPDGSYIAVSGTDGGESQ